MYKDVTLLISTSKAYEELLPGFLKCFRKYFSTFNGNIKSNIQSNKYILGIKETKYKDFSSRTIQALKEIKTKYIMFFLEDFYLRDYVDSSYIENALVQIGKPKIGSVILHDEYPPVTRGNLIVNKYFVECKPFAPFKTTTQATLWKKKYLLKILRRGENPWQFEYLGTFRSHRISKYKVLYPNNNYYRFGVNYIKGGILQKSKIREESLAFLEKENIILPQIQLQKLDRPNKFLFSKWHSSSLYRAFYMYFSIYFRFIKCKTKEIPLHAKIESKPINNH